MGLCYHRHSWQNGFVTIVNPNKKASLKINFCGLHHFCSYMALWVICSILTNYSVNRRITPTEYIPCLAVSEVNNLGFDCHFTLHVLRITCFSGPFNMVLLSCFLCALTIIVLFSAELVEIDIWLLNKISATNEHNHNKQTNTKNETLYVKPVWIIKHCNFDHYFHCVIVRLRWRECSPHNKGLHTLSSLYIYFLISVNRL